ADPGTACAVSAPSTAEPVRTGAPHFSNRRGRLTRRMKLMRIRLFAALVAIALCAGPAMAQEQRGSIEGIVKDASGGVLPGVTVALAGGSGAKLDTVSDAQGLYRFPSLAPGTYTVTADLSGFRQGKVESVEVALGQVK